MAKKMLVLVMLVVMLSISACKPVSPQAVVDQSTDQVCRNLVLFKTSTAKLQTENYSDRNALEAQFSVVRMNFNNLVQSVANLKTVEVNNFQDAANNLINDYQNVPTGTSVADTLTALAAPLDQVKKAADDLSTALKCAPAQ